MVGLSAKTEPALKEVAGRLASQLEEEPELDPTDLAYSLATTRSAFSERAVILGSEREQILTSLAALADGKEAPGLIRGLAPSLQHPVFLFPGQGSQWQGMAAELAQASPVFAGFLSECEVALSPHLDFSLGEVLRDTEGAASIERIEVVQPALFAVMVSLAKLWRHFGVSPAAVVGHSQGEIAAAHIAGGLSLDQAARLAALRSQIIAGIAGKGALVSIAMGAKELDSLLARWEGAIEVAALNSPSSTVLSGDRKSLDQLLAHCESEGLRAREIPGTIASHSAYVEELRDQVLEAFADLSPQSGQIPLHSTVSGEVIDTATMDAEYWYSNLRQTVLFEPVTRGLLEAGHRVLIEVSPHPVFALALEETVESTLTDPNQASVLETLRREEGGPERFQLSLARAHTAGAALDWEALLKGKDPKRVPLPTYPFQRQRYWWVASNGAANAAAMGLVDPEHPLLGAAIADPTGEGFLLTGRISTETHPWLKDHAAADTVLLPGTAFVEFCLQAAEKVGAAGLKELTLQAPLILPDQGAAAIQVKVGEPDEQSGEREISIYSHLQDSLPEEESPPWVTHATGTLCRQEELTAPKALVGPWPPEGAQPIEIEDLYERLTDIGLQYGPAFQGLSAAYQEGEEIYAEISLASDQREAAQDFAIHPALLDAAFHAGVLGALASGEESLRLPFAWRDVSVHSPGASELRVKVSLNEEEICLEAFDAEGVEVARVGSLVARPISPEVLQGSRSGDGLFAIAWSEVALESESSPSIAALAGPELPGVDRYGSVDELSAAIEAGAEPPAVVLLSPQRPKGALAEAALTATQDTLALIQRWIADPNLSPCRLALLTEGAMATAEAESPDPAQAALWGLLRSAQSEHPGRIALLDTDQTEDSLNVLPGALGLSQEPQLALREGKAFAPRLVRIPVPQSEQDQEPKVAIDPEKTILITGGTGALASHLARHLTETHGARHLLLVSRSGTEAQGAKELQAELGSLGAGVKIAACDVSDPKALQALLAKVPKAHPLGAVIHTAATLKDGTVDHLDPEGLAEVFGPKAIGAFNLHEATKEADLSAFVLFSSVAGTLGSPGQANYAAANVFCDALAQKRRSEGLPGTSIAWGAWIQQSGLTAALSETDIARMRRAGIEPLSDQQGLELFDRALGEERALSMALGLNRPALRTLATAGVLPSMMRGLISVSSKRKSAAAAALAAKLAALPEAERERYLLEVVRSEVAAVLGHPSGAAVDPDKAFKDMGFDSLAAVELRNRLNAVTGVNLPVTAVFDYPNPARLAESLLSKLQPAMGDGKAGEKTIEAEFERLGSLLSELESEEQRDHAAAHLRRLFGTLRTEDESDLADATDDEMFAVLEDELGQV
jgi:acyl transferase domain-containing protein/acyl carrier protein